MESKYNFKKLMTERHSTRKFESKEIPKEILKDIISTSLLSPSWTNSQPWKIYVASGNALSEIKKYLRLNMNKKLKINQICLLHIEIHFLKYLKIIWEN